MTKPFINFKYSNCEHDEDKIVRYVLTVGIAYGTSGKDAIFTMW